MPLTYAHYRFGKRCLDYLPQDILNVVKENIDYYLYGLQGPDIFLYHNLFKEDDVTRFGNYMHKLSMTNTLKLFNKNILKTKNRDASLSYVLGYISHFMLDSYCNTYIDKASKIKEISKLEILKEIENYYYLKDKIGIKKYNISSYFKPSKEIVETMYCLYGNFRKDTYKNIIYDYKTKLFLLNDNTQIKKEILNRFFKLTNKRYLIEDKRKECFPFCIRCDKYFEIALIHYKKLIPNYINNLTKNTELDPYFRNNLFLKNNSDEIKILDISEEENFIIYDFED